MAHPKYLKRLPKEEIMKHMGRFPGLKKYEVECRLLLDSIKPKDELHPYRERYKIYMKTMHWLATRNAKIKMVGGVCERCASSSNLSVHHKNYRNLYDVSMDDLEVLCWDCHSAHHN